MTFDEFNYDSWPATAPTTSPDGYLEIGEPAAMAALYTALGKAQLAFTPLHRSKTVSIATRDGQRYSFAYAPLEDLLAATRPALGANGLAVMTPIVRQENNGSAKVLVVIAHEAGARIITSFAFTPTGDMRTTAGQITYLRRYGYSAILNLAADDDEDDAPPPTATTATSAPRSAPARPQHASGATERPPTGLSGAVPPADHKTAEHAPETAPGVMAMITSNSDPLWMHWQEAVAIMLRDHPECAPQLPVFREPETQPVSAEELRAAGRELKTAYAILKAYTAGETAK